MGCFPCAGSSSSTKKPEKSRKNPSDDNTNQRGNDDRRQPTKGTLEVNPNKGGNKGKNKATNPSAAADEVDASKRSSSVADANKSKYKIFQYAELESATENFKPENLLGEGGFGKVHKGRLVDTGQIVAVKRLNLEGCQGIREFNTEIAFLSSVNHPNLVKLIGSCAEGDKRLLVYEYMPLRSLEDHLHGRPSNNKKLDWRTRMKIATGAAQGLEYLHNGMKPPIIHRDLKCANILLEEGYHPKLSDFGLAKVGPSEGKSHVSTRVMGTYGYCDPNYASTGQLTTKSDIYSFGVVLLEIVTGRKAIDDTKPKPEQNLVEWARPLFRDRNNFPRMADPLLEGRFPAKGIYQALAISSTCLHINPSARPRVQDVVAALNYLVSSSQTHDPLSHRVRISGESSSAANKPGTDDK